MNVLFSISGNKKSVDEILSLLEKELSGFVQIGRKEFSFTANGVAGKFQTSYLMPVIKQLDMVFTDAAETQIEQIQEIGNKIFGGAKNASLSLRTEKPVGTSHLTNALSQEFITALNLNLRDHSGLSVRSGNKKLEILNGLYGNRSVAVMTRRMLDEKSISELCAEAKCTIGEVLSLPTGVKIAEKGKKFPLPLKNEDLGWWNVTGTGHSGLTGCIITDNSKNYLAEASVGFKTFKSNLSNLFSDVFLNTVQSMNAIEGLTLVKNTGAKHYNISIGKNNDSAYEGLTSAKATVKRALGAKKTFNAAVQPEVVRILNAMYDSAMNNVNVKEAFMEYILNNANSTCICGKKFEDTLKKEIVEIGCHSEKKHLIHRSCWNKWAKRNPPKQFDWNESSCPFCETDSSIYNTPWKNGRLVWKNI